MKAIRKIDGKVIEVTERASWNGEKIYTADGTFYRKHELDFSVSETKEAEGEVLSGWVARSNDGPNDLGLRVYTVKPARKKNRNGWNGHGEMSYLIDCRLFPDLTWDSEPMEVEITIKPKKK